MKSFDFFIGCAYKKGLYLTNIFVDVIVDVVV